MFICPVSKRESIALTIKYLYVPAHICVAFCCKHLLASIGKPTSQHKPEKANLSYTSEWENEKQLSETISIIKENKSWKME